MRPKFETIYMCLALNLKERSTCSRLQVGAVITSTDFRHVYGVGYNANATGLDNCCDRDEPGNCGCIHAELNAIINNTSSRQQSKYVFVTTLPCVACSKAIVNLGNVQTVFYAQPYRDLTGLGVLLKSNIEVVRL